MEYQFSADFAKKMDAADPLRSFRDEFHFPRPGKDQVIYFCGNSLGLQPKKATEDVNREMEDWKNLAVAGHTDAKNPWVSYEKDFQEPLAKIIGARPEETVAMNSLTVNLHLMMATFYRPKGRKSKILIDGSTFPSDRYAVFSQAKFHGLNPEETIIEVNPNDEESPVTSKAVLEAIEKHKDELCLVLLSGVHYYTGEVFDMKAVIEKAREHDIYSGLDLAHAIGNVPLHLHDWGTDFAVWCSYKYLNSGPGAIGGAFVHQKHHKKNTFRLAGWWGHNPETRFNMPHAFDPQPDILGWQLSNVPVLSLAPHRSALEIFSRAGMDEIRNKSLKLTGFLVHIIKEIREKHNLPFKIITPLDKKHIGAQISLSTGKSGKELYNRLRENNVVVDWRHPSVIRMAPAPLYNSFEEIYRFGKILEDNC